ncbi:MAG: response regulator transcription factor [Spirochaetales bacterium]|nr:response regulator transcription factor [Spirochaetales bacterium]
MKCKIIFAEDQQLIRESLAMLISDDPDLEITGTAANGQEAIDLCRAKKPDLMLLDVQMPVLDGLKTAEILRKEQLNVKIVLITTFPDSEMLHEALSLGVEGFLLKDADPSLFIHAIKSIAAGLIVFQKPLMEHLRLLRCRPSNASPAELGLTEKEIDCMRHIAKGLGNKEIAYLESCSEGTVKNRVSGILSKLGLEARTQIAVYAIKNGFVTDIF